MATALYKPVTRELLAAEQFGGKHRGRKILCTIAAGDIVEFRYKGTRSKFSCSLHSCFALAKLLTLEREYQDRLKAYSEAKKAGKKRLRKPRKPNFSMGLSPQLMKAANTKTPTL